jgi:glucokinase
MSPVETIGIDLGGTKMLSGVVDEECNVIHVSREHSTGQTEDELLDLAEREIREALEARPDAAAIGIGVPCTIDRERGVAVLAVNLPITDVPIRDILAERIGLPVFLDNDANAAMLAEHLFGAAKGVRNALMLTVGTGIGGGLLIGGEIYRGTQGGGAELGHTVIDVNGPKCQGACPNHGCIESVASGTALGREGRAAAEREPDSALARLLEKGLEVDGKAVTTAAIAGDDAAAGVIELIGGRLGIALANFANVFEPEVMVIGGGVIAAGDLLLEPARREVLARALPPMNDTPVAAAVLGNDAGMIGAAAMARLELEQGSS